MEQQHTAKRTRQKWSKDINIIVMECYYKRKPIYRAPMAQLVEHRAVMLEVAGSNPGRINTQDQGESAAFVMTSANG